MENERHQSISIPASRSGNLLSKNVQNELFIPTFDEDMNVLVITCEVILYFSHVYEAISGAIVLDTQFAKMTKNISKILKYLIPEGIAIIY